MSRWIDGTTVVSQNDLEKLAEHPLAFTARTLKLTRKFVEERSVSDAQMVLFNYFNFDPYIHEKGYDQSIKQSLQQLFHTIDILRSEHADMLFLTISDHGMTPQHPDCRISPVKDPELAALSYANPAGAGRILFFYPRKGCVLDLQHAVEDRIKTHGELLTREDFLSRCYRGKKCYAPERIGELVAIARDDKFPAASP